MTALERYELIRPILQGEKPITEVHHETKVPIRTLYWYLARFRAGHGQLEALADKSRAPKTRPKSFTESDKDKVVDYKLNHPDKSARKIATELTQTGELTINYHSVADVLKARGVTYPLF